MRSPVQIHLTLTTEEMTKSFTFVSSAGLHTKLEPQAF